MFPTTIDHYYITLIIINNTFRIIPTSYLSNIIQHKNFKIYSFNDFKYFNIPNHFTSLIKSKDPITNDTNSFLFYPQPITNSNIIESITLSPFLCLNNPELNIKQLLSICTWPQTKFKLHFTFNRDLSYQITQDVLEYQDIPMLIHVIPDSEHKNIITQKVNDNPDLSQFLNNSIFGDINKVSDDYLIPLEYSKTVFNHENINIHTDKFIHHIPISDISDLLTRYFQQLHNFNNITDLLSHLNNNTCCIAKDIIIYILSHFDLSDRNNFQRIPDLTLDPNLYKDFKTLGEVPIPNIPYETYHVFSNTLTSTFSNFTAPIRGYISNEGIFFTESCLQSINSKYIPNIILNSELATEYNFDPFEEMLKYMNLGFTVNKSTRFGEIITRLFNNTKQIST